VKIRQESFAVTFPMHTGRNLALKSVHRKSQWQEARRADALERQRAQRQGAIDYARCLADIRVGVESDLPQVRLRSKPTIIPAGSSAVVMVHLAYCTQGKGVQVAHRGSDDGATQSMQPEPSSGQQQEAGAQQSMRNYFAEQLMQHEWMTDIPEDLAQNWCISAPKVNRLDVMLPCAL